MKQYRLFIVFSQYQLLNAINFIINNPELNDNNNDILIDAKVYKSMPKQYKLHLGIIFNIIYEANCNHTNKFSLSSVYELIENKQKKIYNLLFLKVLLSEILAHLSYNISKTLFLKLRIHKDFNPYKYSDIYLNNLTIIVKTIFNILYKNNVRSVHIMEDGVFTYTRTIQAEYFKKKYKDLAIVIHLYEPSLMVCSVSNVQIEALPKLSSSDQRSLGLLNKIFAFEINKFCDWGGVVFLDQHPELYSKDVNLRKEVNMKKIELFKSALSIFNEDLILKIHPLSLYGPVSYNYQNAEQYADINKYPLELIILNTKKCPAIISISSTASFNPYIALDEKPSAYELIIIDRLFQLDKISKHFSNIDKFIDGAYKRFKFYRPETQEEYVNVLKEIRFIQKKYK